MYEKSDDYVKKDDDKIPKTPEKHEEMVDFLDNLGNDDKDLVESDKKHLDVTKKDKSAGSFLEPEKKIKKEKPVKSLYAPPKPFNMKKFFFLLFLIIVVAIVIISLFLFQMNDFDDSDGDGIADSDDFFPDKNAMIKVSINSFKFKDPNAYSVNYTLYYRVFELFQSTVGNETEYSFGPVTVGSVFSRLDYTTFSFMDVVVDVSDDVALHAITIQFLMYDTDDTIQLDIDDDYTKGLTLEYDIVFGNWTGDDETGISDGSVDGNLDDIDCYVEYDIKTI